MDEGITLKMIYDEINLLKNNCAACGERLHGNDVAHKAIMDKVSGIDIMLSGKGNGDAMSYDVVKKVIRAIDKEDYWTTIKFAGAARRFCMTAFASITISGLVGFAGWLLYLYSIHMNKR